MNPTNDDNLKTAAEAGDMNLLYSLIQADPSVLEHIDSIPFVETPLHIAASKEHLQFATEVMMLKPSFAWKLNPQGFSPIHLAMENSEERMVLRFVKINKDLVKVKGKEGQTPLHLASKKGKTGLLAKFLSACPESIEEVTVRNETALHVAVKNEQYEALQVLVGWLKRNTRRGAGKLEHEILNWEDEAGNTILHVSAQNSQSQALRVLLKTGIILNAKNLENSTALDIAGNAEIKSMLVSAGAKSGSNVTDARTFAHKLRSKITIFDKIITYILRLRKNILEDQRNAFLVVATLVVTTTYQSALTPPGGVYEVSARENTVTTTSLNSTTADIRGNGGLSIMSIEHSILFTILNMVSLLVSVMAICILIPGGFAGVLVFAPMNLFLCVYLFCLFIVSPTSFIVYFFVFLISSLWASGMIILLYSIFQRYANDREMETRATRGNV